MAIGDAYATVEDLEARLNRDDDGTFEDLLGRASRAVEQFCRRQFNKTDTATVRRFLPADVHRLPVDDFWTVDGLVVEVNGTSWDTDTVDPRPWNGIFQGQPGWPFFNLHSVSRRWPFHRSTIIEITAKWGWAAVPDAIKEATLDVAVFASYGSTGSYPKRQESIQDYSVSYAVPGVGEAGSSVPTEMVKAAPYRRKLWGIA